MFRNVVKMGGNTLYSGDGGRGYQTIFLSVLDAKISCNTFLVLNKKGTEKPLDSGHRPSGMKKFDWLRPKRPEFSTPIVRVGPPLQSLLQQLGLPFPFS
jgi:hypothetical protein